MQRGGVWRRMDDGNNPLRKKNNLFLNFHSDGNRYAIAIIPPTLRARHRPKHLE